MSLSSMFSPLKDPANAGPKKKRVLLVDSSRAKRDLRSETMRKLGIEVDCAADISEARCWWRPGLYDLVLIDLLEDKRPVERFCTDVRSATPPQHTMFLIGGPAYFSASPDAGPKTEEDSALPSVMADDHGTTVHGTGEKTQRWGLLEACRQISAIRSVCDARTRAIHNRPEPHRDSEGARHSAVPEVDASEMIRGESQ